MNDLTYLKQWSEPDGDNDQLFNVRMEVKSLIRAYEKGQRQLEAAKSVMWMAEQYAEGHAIAETGKEQRELETVMEVLKS